MSVTGIDFSSLCLLDALDLAILIEEEAEERYEEFAHQMDTHRTPGAANFFRFMSQNESKHGSQLRARRVNLFGSEPRTVKRSMLWDVEAPDYDKTRAHMTARQAMQAALESEEKAHDFFAGALPHVENPEVRRLFEELRDEEIEHQEMVKAELQKIPPDSPLRTEDFEDEPNAQ